MVVLVVSGDRPVAGLLDVAARGGSQCRVVVPREATDGFASVRRRRKCGRPHPHPTSSASTATNACVAKRDGRAATDLKNGAKECEAERAADPAAFTKKYGTNKNGKNAYGKCVSGKARHATEQETEARVNAAKTCRKLKAEQKATFEADYGTKKNAFGKCVSETAKAS
jgi:hypothetical protein